MGTILDDDGRIFEWTIHDGNIDLVVREVALMAEKHDAPGDPHIAADGYQLGGRPIYIDCRCNFGPFANLHAHGSIERHAQLRREKMARHGGTKTIPYAAGHVADGSVII